MINKIFRLLLLVLPISILVLLFTQKSNINDYLSKEIKSQTPLEVKKRLDFTIDSLYNYNLNGKSFKITFLEFGADNCLACRKMKVVMSTIKQDYRKSVNVIYYNTFVPQYQEIMKYYGVSVIPTQILLDSTGHEFYRNIGFISALDLKKNFKFIK